MPTNYANAFLVPARKSADRDGDHDTMEDSIRKLSHYAGSVANVYGLDARRWWTTTRPEVPFEGAEAAATLSDLCDKVLDALRDGEAPHADQ